LWLSFALFLAPGAGALGAEGRPQSVPLTSPIVPNLTALEYIDSNFENASPVWYELASDGTILIHLLYDHERSSPNRASGHVHFQIHARPGAKLKLEITNLENVWNSMRTPVARQFQAMCISENGRDWTTVPVDNSS